MCLHQYGVVNCFEDELPATICEAAQIEVLSLNGLGAADGCRNTVKFPFSDVTLFNTIGGTLPDCLWHLRNLTTLHLTGNGLTGKLLSQLPPYSSMTDLSLSHNKFSGNIPVGVQQIQKVDLSYNQFSGKYEDSPQLWKNSFVNLEINRLSGQLPVSKLTNVSDLNILKGNLFSCDTIPANDEYADDYVCGSDSLNESLYLFGSTLMIGCCVMLVVAVLTVVSSRFGSMLTSSWVSENISWLRIYLTYVDQMKQQGVDNSNLLKIIALSDKFRKTVWLFIQLAIVMFVTVAPIYIIKCIDDDNTYSTHTNTYGWFWTLAYMRGVVPSGLIMMSWVVLITVCFYHMIVAHPTESNSSGHPSSSPKSVNCQKCFPEDHAITVVDKKLNTTFANTFKRQSMIMLSLVVNVAVTIVVNTLYIYSTTQPFPVYIHVGIQFSLAVFRLVYSYCVFPILSRPIIDPIANIWFRLRLLTMDNLIIPCLVTAFASPACFQVQLLAA